MNVSSTPPPSFVVYLAIIFIFFFFGSIIMFLLSPFTNVLKRKLEESMVEKIKSSPHELFEDEDSLLKEKISFYKNLSEKQQIRFLVRLQQFKQMKRFIGKDDLEITDEMKTLISAAAVQLTFGLEIYKLEYFHTFIIYPDIYSAPFTDDYYKGHTSQSGTVALSWNYFTEGYSIGDDKLNLGLHELAHALDLSRVLDETDLSFSTFFQKWMRVAADEIENINADKNKFLRKYGASNQREFFAVCVEHFFEAPEAFYKELPFLFKLMCKLLKQNPIPNSVEASWIVSNNPSPEILNKQPEFDSYPQLQKKFTVLSLTAMLIIFSAVGNKGYEVIASFIAFYLSVFLGLMIFSYRKVEIKADHLTVKNMYSSNGKSQYFAFENIVSVSFPEYRGIKRINVVYLNRDELKTFSKVIGISEADEESVRNYLSEKYIIT